MSQLTINSAAQPEKPLLQTSDFSTIRRQLSAVGMRFERWQSRIRNHYRDRQRSHLAAYQAEIDKLVTAESYQTWDAVSMHPDHPQKEAFRNKFLAKHTHSEDEKRFFVRGHGLFTVHVDDRVFALLCEKDDMISVPANTRHWFDMCPNSVFTAIRLFNNPEGWAANFTGMTSPTASLS